MKQLIPPDVWQKLSGVLQPMPAERWPQLISTTARVRSLAEVFAVGFAAVAIAANVAMAVLLLEPAQTYPEFIVGSIAFVDATKLQDLIVGPLAILSFGTVTLILTALYKALNRADAATRDAFTSQLIWWSIGPWMGALEVAQTGRGNDLGVTFAVGLFGGLVAFIAIYGYVGRRAPTVTPAQIGALVLCALVASLIPWEAALALGRLPKSLIDFTPPGDVWRWLRRALAVTLPVAAVLALARPNSIPRLLPAGALISQMGLPLFYFALYPSRLVSPDGQIFKYDTHPALLVVLAILVTIAALDVVRRFLTHTGYKSVSRLFSPLAFGGLISAAAFGVTVPPSISPDDFHFGEMIVGSVAYAFGALPYVDYLPPHGLVDDMPMALSKLLYDNLGSSIGNTNQIWFSCLAVGAVFSLYLYSGSLLVVVLSVALATAGSPIYLLFVPFICLWLSPRLQRSPCMWLAVWLLGALPLLLLIPAQGLILMMAFSPLALWIGWSWIRGTEFDLWPLLAALIAALILLVVVTPLGGMLVGAARYVLENAPLNQTAYGIPLAWSNNALGADVFRFSWIAVAALLMTITYWTYSRGGTIEALLPPASILLVVLLLIPYSMGRIDPGVPSRPGVVSIGVLTLLVPIALWRLLPRPLWAPYFAFAAVAITLVLPGSIGIGKLAAAVRDRVPTAPLTDAAAAGFNGIGRAAIVPEHLARLTKIRALLAKELEPNETFLNLTSRNALYYYFHRQPPIPANPYNMVPIAQQKRAVHRLENSPPRIALMSADNINHDGGGLALRTPVLYRFITDHYVPSYRNGFVIGTLRDQDRGADDLPSISLRDVSDSEWDRGVLRSDRRTLRIDDPFAWPLLAVGSRMKCDDGTARVITALARDGRVTLDQPFCANASGTPRFLWDAPRAKIDFYRHALLAQGLESKDLHEIPIAWGRSEASLTNRMTERFDISSQPMALHQLTRSPSGLSIAGPDPFVIYDVTKLGISGRNAGLLRFRFSCIGQTEAPRLQVFWWGDDVGSSETYSLALSARPGVLIVPLDASSLWTSMKRVSGVRIDLQNPVCAAVKFEEVKLYSRDALDE